MGRWASTDAHRGSVYAASADLLTEALLKDHREVDVYTLLGLKGGVGKTSSAVMFAEAAACCGHQVILVDTDPQASATKWWVKARERGEPLSFGLHQITLDDPGTVGSIVDQLIEDHQPDVLFVDTASAGAGDRTRINEAVAASTGCIVPCRASFVEAAELRDTTSVAAEARVPAWVLRVAVDLRMREAKDFVAFLEGEGHMQFKDAIPYTAELLRMYGRKPTKLFGYQWAWAEIEKSA